MSQWYINYCREHDIPIRYGKDREWHEKFLKRASKKAEDLKKLDISGLSKEEAENKLKSKAEELQVGMSGISLLLLKAFLSWIIGKILDRAFNDNISNG